MCTHGCSILHPPSFAGRGCRGEAARGGPAGAPRSVGVSGVGGSLQPRPPRFKSAGGISVAAKTNVTYFLLSPRGAEEPRAGHRARRGPPAPRHGLRAPRAPHTPPRREGHRGVTAEGGVCEQNPPILPRCGVSVGCGMGWAPTASRGCHRCRASVSPSRSAVGVSGGVPRCCPCRDPPTTCLCHSRARGGEIAWSPGASHPVSRHLPHKSPPTP